MKPVFIDLPIPTTGCPDCREGTPYTHPYECDKCRKIPKGYLVEENKQNE